MAVVLVCKVCGKEFEVRPSAIKNGRRYCSRICRDKGNWPAVYSICINCGAEYRVAPHHADEAKYCSLDCMGEYRRRTGELLGDKAHSWKGGDIETVCDNCGTIIKKLRGEHKEDAHHFCNHKCMGEYRVGKNHPLWKGGHARSRHGGKQYKEWREAVYARDNWTCEECGSRGGKLNAHHVFPFADYPELRYEIWNGRTLCTNCHKEIHWKSSIARIGEEG